MIRLISFIVLFSSLNLQAADLTQITKPTSVKVAAAAKTWEKIYTPNLCWPDAATFKISDTKNLDIEKAIISASKQISTDVTALTSLDQLQSKAAISAATKNVLSDMGIKNDPKLAAQLVRIAEKAEARSLFLTTTSNEKGKFELTGTAFVIYDLENKELTLLTTGDSFNPSKCE